ncbi:MAG: stage III sporulation protein AG [Eubacterium sp.]|nr:stage III sporulation protein AG [Eubacterium sp.]MCI8920005.1 stage III sporulation protein AG [Eubacterium sp.]
MKRFTDLLKKMDRTKWLILGLGGILLLVIALPVDDRSSEKVNQALEKALDSADTQEDPAGAYEKQITKELEKTLSQMEGAGEVHVMITFQDGGESVVEKDITKTQNAGDSIQYQESAIYQESDTKQPYVSQQKLPSIEGVLVVAQGGGDSSVKQELRDAVMALFPIEAHKIKIVKMHKEP